MVLSWQFFTSAANPFRRSVHIYGCNLFLPVQSISGQERARHNELWLNRTLCLSNVFSCCCNVLRIPVDSQYAVKALPYSTSCLTWYVPAATSEVSVFLACYECNKLPIAHSLQVLLQKQSISNFNVMN